MSLGLQKNWLSMVWCAGLALLVSWALTGCRFGNHEVDGNDPDQIHGYYESAFRSLQYCVYWNDPTVTDPSQNPKSNCPNSPATQIPAEVSAMMTNPVWLQMTDTTNNRAEILSNDHSYGLPIDIVQNATKGPLGPTQLGVRSGALDVACNYSYVLTESGQYIRENGPFSSGTQLPLAGRIELQLVGVHTFEGACGNGLQKWYQCYQSSNNCGQTDATSNEALYQVVHSIFDPFVQAGAIAAGNEGNVIPYLTHMTYDVNYQ